MTRRDWMSSKLFWWVSDMTKKQISHKLGLKHLMLHGKRIAHLIYSRM